MKIPANSSYSAGGGDDSIVLSHHAKVRIQQRGIPRWLPDLTVRHGEKFYSRGARVFHFHNHLAWSKAEAAIHSMGLPVDNHWRDVYFVVKSDLVLTGGWMAKPIRRQTRRRKKWRGRS